MARLPWPAVAVVGALGVVAWLAAGGLGPAVPPEPPEPAALPPAPPASEEPPPPLASAPDLAEGVRRARAGRLDRAWAEVLALVEARKWAEALAAFEALRKDEPDFCAQPARAEVLARIRAALASGRAQKALEAALARARLPADRRALLEGRLAATAEVLAGSESLEDLDALTRHVARFLVPDAAGRPGGKGLGDEVLRAFVADRRARRGKDANPPVADADAAEQRRVEQLEKLRQRDAVGLLDSIHAGLAWLALHQRDDGSFSDKACEERCTALKHEPKNCLADAPSTGDNYQTAATALATIAFLDFRDQDVLGWFDPYLGRAIAWLVKRQRPNGSFPGSGQQYATAMAVMALGQAAASTGDPVVREACRKGIGWFASTQGPLGGFRYGPSDPRGDLSVTGWVAQAVEAARGARVAVPFTLENGLDLYLRYVWLGEHRFSYQNGGGESWSLSPVGMLLGHLAWKEKDPAVVESWKRHLKGWPPRRLPDLYPLYYGVRLSILLTGALEDPWRAWTFDLAKRQVAKGTPAGSFPTSVLRRNAGVTVTSALAVLTLEHALYLR